MFRVRAPPFETEVLTSLETHKLASRTRLCDLQGPIEMGDDAMKKLLIVLIAGLALILAHESSRLYAGSQKPAQESQLMHSSSVTAGTVTICFEPGFATTESCSNKGAIGVPFATAGVGSVISDAAGNGCGTSIVTSSVTGDIHSPIPQNQITVSKITNFDAATGTGDGSIIDYNGGECEGTEFEKKGATELNRGTFHFVISENGNRVDTVVTTLTDSVGDIGAFNLTGFAINQNK